MDELSNLKPLDDDESNTLRSLLRRYSAANLDQWEAWRTDTPHGTVYIVMRLCHAVQERVRITISEVFAPRSPV